jgi:hypothetical protein
MSTLAEIEKAAEALSAVEKQRLIVFLATRLRGQGEPLPPPRSLTRGRSRSGSRRTRLSSAP